MVITTAQFHSSTPDLRFKLCVMLEIHDVEDMFMVPAENKAKHLSTVNHTIKTIHHHQTSITKCMLLSCHVCISE